MFPFYDRTDELAQLREFLNQVRTDCSRMVVLTGRRRIGKSTLANRAFSDCGLPYVFLFVSAEKTERGNIDSFCRDNADILGIADLPVSFENFASFFEFLLKRSARDPMICVIDEFQNLERVAPAFLSDLQKLWDKYRKQTKMLLLLTGSVASAMKQIIDNPAAPLFGRKNGDIKLRAFSTAVVRQVLNDFAPKALPEDLLTLYCLTGGVPKYLEVLMECGAITQEKMICEVVKPSSFFITEADVLFRSEFKSDYAVYFEILEKIASGKTKRQELVSAMAPKEISGQLLRLETFYNIIEKVRPVESTKESDYRFRIGDDYIRFWFRFIYPHLGLIQQGVTHRLQANILESLPDFTGRHVLENWFKQQLWETGLYSVVGSWWDRKGENEIDIVAINTFDKEIVFVEVKRDPDKINLPALQQKAYAFMAQSKRFGKFKMRVQGRSLKDL